MTFWADMAVLCLFIFTIWIHEMGHYVDAKRLGLYNGWYFRGVTAGIKLKKPFPKAYLYLGGLVYSFFSYPIVLVFASLEYLPPRAIWIWPIALFGVAIGDFLIMYNYKDAINLWTRETRRIWVERDTWFNRYLVHVFAVEDEIIVWVKRR